MTESDSGRPCTPPDPLREASLPDYGGDDIDYSSYFITSMIFPTFEEAFEWAQNISIRYGFFLTKSSYKKQRDGRPVKYLKCDRGHRNTTEDRDMENAVRKNTKRKGVKCPFRIKVTCMVDDQGWKIIPSSGLHGLHNHPMMVYREGHRQVSGLSPAAKQLVSQMSSACAKPSHIMAAVKDAFPTENPNMRHIYNFRSRVRVDASEGRDVVNQFLHLANERKYVSWVAADPDTRVVTHAFMAHPEMANMLRTYPHVIGMDSTYKTNRYNMPFFEIVGITPTNQNFLITYALMKTESYESYKWVLEKLKLYIGFEVTPKVILTDRELGLMKAVKEIFPNTAHLLCRWHINKDVLAKVYHLCKKDMVTAEKFRNGRWSKIMNATTEDEYEFELQQMKDTWGRSRHTIVDYVKKTWLVHKNKFIPAWTNKVLHFGNVNMCRVESQHSVLKQWLGSSKGSMDSIFNRVHRATEGLLIQIRHHLEDSRRRIGVEYRGMPLHNLSGYVSFHALKILKQEVNRMRELSDDVYERCGCAMLMTHGLPCACTIHTSIQGGTGLYLDQVHPFWKTLVIGDGVDIPIFEDELEQDTTHFRSLVDEVLLRDASFVRSVNRVLFAELYPEDVDYPCITVLPWSAPSTTTGPYREFALLTVANYHYVRLDMSPNFPVPPVAGFWYDVHDFSAQDWDQRYVGWIATWHTLATN